MHDLGKGEPLPSPFLWPGGKKQEEKGLSTDAGARQAEQGLSRGAAEMALVRHEAVPTPVPQMQDKPSSAHGGGGEPLSQILREGAGGCLPLYLLQPLPHTLSISAPTGGRHSQAQNTWDSAAAVHPRRG